MNENRWDPFPILHAAGGSSGGRCRALIAMAVAKCLRCGLYRLRPRLRLGQNVFFLSSWM